MRQKPQVVLDSLQTLSPQLHPALTAALKEPRNSFGSQAGALDLNTLLLESSWYRVLLVSERTSLVWSMGMRCLTRRGVSTVVKVAF